jgi:GntR family transcriptional regulator
MSEWGDMRPAYLRIADAVRARIDSGDIPPGEPIPSVHALMGEFTVANTTVQKAVRSLKAAGLVETRPGRGVYVRERQQLLSRSASYIAPAADGEKAPYRAKTKIVEVGEAVPPEDIADALGLEVDESAVMRRRVMLLNGVEAVELTDSWYPLGLARGSALASERPLRGGSPAELSRMGYESDHCTEEVTARMPTSEEVRTLSLGAGVPVLRILRTVFTGDDQRIEVMSMVMAGDRYKLFYELPVH